MHIVIAGASGFLGSHLVEQLRAGGHDVTALVRRPAAAGESRWDPYAGELDQDIVDSADVVINLAGSPTAGNPHSKKWAENLRQSRVTTTRVLAEAIAASRKPPAFLAGNGISYYGDHGQAPVTEATTSTGDAFLTTVTREWQAAADPAVRAGARVCILRTSPVLDRGSAPLKQLLLLFKFGLGARLGSGGQYFPSLSLRDWVGAVTFLVTSDLAGPINLCSPVTPTNAEFTSALASCLNRRAFLVAPRFVLSPAAGRLAPELLGSVNARPAALLDAGFEFQDGDVRDVLCTALN